MKANKFYHSISFLSPAVSSVLLICCWIALPANVYCQNFFESAVKNPFGFNFTVSDGNMVFHTLADIDNDGDLDDFVIHQKYVQPCWVTSAFEFYENQGTKGNPIFVKIPDKSFGLPQRVANLTLVDIDADGDLDAFISNLCIQPVITFHRNTGTAKVPQFSETPTQTLGTIVGIGYASLVFGDLDGDGDYDALINGSRPAQFIYLENTGTPTNYAFTMPLINPFGLSLIGFNSAEWSQFGDWDCDGDLDILNTHLIVDGTLNNWLLSIYENNGKKSAPMFKPGVSSTQLIFPMALGDMDGDGDLDVFSDKFYFKNLSKNDCLSTASVAQEKEAPVSMFPNPAQDYLTLKIPGASSLKPCTIEVINSLGKVMKRLIHQNTDFSSDIQVDLSGLSSGFYVVKINGGGQFVAEKFLKVE
jgi:hypothetical protein